LLAAAGAAIGVVIGLAGLVVLSHWHVTSGIVQGDVSYRAIGEGLLMAAVMAIAGAAYPAFRIARVPPVESLRGS
jgi:putative ABC transport system permease protein